MHLTAIEISATRDRQRGLRFHVEMISARGRRAALWHGNSYEAAILLAEETGADLCPVIDRVHELREIA